MDEITTDELVHSAAEEVAVALRDSDWTEGVSKPVQGYTDTYKLMFISNAGDVFEVSVSRALTPSTRR